MRLKSAERLLSLYSTWTHKPETTQQETEIDSFFYGGGDTRKKSFRSKVSGGCQTKHRKVMSNLSAGEIIRFLYKIYFPNRCYEAFYD